MVTRGDRNKLGGYGEEIQTITYKTDNQQGPMYTKGGLSTLCNNLCGKRIQR